MDYLPIYWEDYRTGIPDVDDYLQRHRIQRSKDNVMGKGNRHIWVSLLQERKIFTDILEEVDTYLLKDFGLKALNCYKEDKYLYINSDQSYDPHFILEIIAEILEEHGRGDIYTSTGKIHTRVAEARIKKYISDDWKVTVYLYNPCEIYSVNKEYPAYVVAPRLDSSYVDNILAKRRDSQ